MNANLLVIGQAVYKTFVLSKNLAQQNLMLYVKTSSLAPHYLKSISQNQPLSKKSIYQSSSKGNVIDNRVSKIPLDTTNSLNQNKQASAKSTERKDQTCNTKPFYIKIQERSDLSIHSNKIEHKTHNSIHDLKKQPSKELPSNQTHHSAKDSEIRDTKFEQNNNNSESLHEKSQEKHASLTEKEKINVKINPEDQSKNKSILAKKELIESRIPVSRPERILHYGALAAGLGAGALNETFRRWTGRSSDENVPVFFSENNVERLVSKLTKMRGAALKLGQMLSIQDSSVASRKIEDILIRVQNSANYMPQKQLNKVLEQQLGNNWRDMFESFDEKPFAAASIGQVHEAGLNSTLSEKYGFKKVAVKVQYPGVVKSIDSDLSNIQSLLVLSKLLPKGLYLDNTIKVARKELKMECDYIREAESTMKFRENLKSDKNFIVPQIVSELCKPMVLTLEHISGNPVSSAASLDQSVRNMIGSCVLDLCLRELFVFNLMQTDPNWSNFLFDEKTKKIGLLDFGATLPFEKKFLDLYMNILVSAARQDRDSCVYWSEKIGYLTGFESEAMKQAHVDSIMTIGEPFRFKGAYPFGSQKVTKEVKSNISVMLNERLTPPPNETYSLHRKLSGVFLLCSKLSANVECSSLFNKYLENYKFSS